MTPLIRSIRGASFMEGRHIRYKLILSQWFHVSRRIAKIHRRRELGISGFHLPIMEAIGTDFRKHRRDDQVGYFWSVDIVLHCGMMIVFLCDDKSPAGC
jgi:hypothetical protein